MQSLIIITAANAEYFELAQGTIESIRQKPQGQGVSMGFFDLGCTPEQLQWLEEQVDIIKQADWEFDFPGRNEAPEYLKGLLARPWLPKYFPGFEIYLWIDADITFVSLDQRISLPPLDAGSVTSSLGFNLIYDSRNNNYYPTNGQYFELTWSRDSDSWGSDYDFDKSNNLYRYYWGLNDQHTLALGASLNNVDGEPPFYLLSAVHIRGFPAGRFLDTSSATTHVEWRYKFLPRWGVVAFTESGWVADSISELSNAATITSYGFGLRWQAILSKPLHLGVDFAFTDEDNAVY